MSGIITDEDRIEYWSELCEKLQARVKALEAGLGEMRKALEVVGLAWEIEVRGKPDNDGSVTDMVTEALGTAIIYMTKHTRNVKIPARDRQEVTPDKIRRMAEVVEALADCSPITARQIVQEVLAEYLEVEVYLSEDMKISYLRPYKRTHASM